MDQDNHDVSLLISLAIAAAIVGVLIGFSLPAKPHTYSPMLNSKFDYLTVVNEDNPYDFDGEYDQILKENLVYLPDVYGEATLVEKSTARAFLELQHGLSEKGMLVGLLGGYRTREDQQYVYDYYSNLDGWAETNKILLPGYSEHHTGLLLNVLIWHQGPEDATPIWYTETAERQATIPDFKLLHETLADYGFIDRYPLGKEDITGVPSEPYEIRFVGSSKIAHEIMDQNLSLEEYVAQKSKK